MKPVFTYIVASVALACSAEQGSGADPATAGAGGQIATNGGSTSGDSGSAGTSGAAGNAGSGGAECTARVAPKDTPRVSLRFFSEGTYSYRAPPISLSGDVFVERAAPNELILASQT